MQPGPVSQTSDQPASRFVVPLPDQSVTPSQGPAEPTLTDDLSYHLVEEISVTPCGLISLSTAIHAPAGAFY